MSSQIILWSHDDDDDDDDNLTALKDKTSEVERAKLNDLKINRTAFFLSHPALSLPHTVLR